MQAAFLLYYFLKNKKATFSDCHKIYYRTGLSTKNIRAFNTNKNTVFSNFYCKCF